MSENEIVEWYATYAPTYQTLTTYVKNTLEGVLRANNVEFLTVNGRTKSQDSIADKIRRKRYKDPRSQLTDFAGVRVIVYLESHVSRVADLIRASFRIDESNSMNRDAILATNQIGYRSIHFVCDLGPDRARLPEATALADLKFEIQLRTVLQHAWAELSHDRSYKFAGELPGHLERQIFLYAGLLEIADKGLDSVSTQIDAYSNQVKQMTAVGNLDIPIDSVSLTEYLNTWVEKCGFTVEGPLEGSEISKLIHELKDYGVTTLKDLNAIVPKTYAEVARQKEYTTNWWGLVRDWMMLTDYEHYRDAAWKNLWQGMGDEPGGKYNQFAVYSQVVGTQTAKAIMRTFDDVPFDL